MGITHAPTVRDDLAQLISDKVDAGTGAGKIKIYSDIGLTNLLVTFEMADPAFVSLTSGLLTADTIAPVTASATGVALAFEVTDSDDTQVYKGNCGVAGSGAACILNTTSITSGGDVAVNTCTYAAPI